MKVIFKYIIFLSCVCLLIPSPFLGASEQTISLSDAIVKTLDANPGIKIQKEKVRQSEGVLQTASGQFDWVGYGAISKDLDKIPLTDKQERTAKAAAASTGNPVPEYLREETEIYSVGAGKQLRSGVSVAPSISAANYYDNTSLTREATYSDYSIEIVIPLMRELGVANTAAEERAAKSGLTATELLSRYNIAGSIYTTAASYWNCLAASRNLDILKDMEKRGSELFQLVELLIRGGELAPEMLYQAKAKLLLRQSNLAEARLTLYESSQSLAIAMGLTADALQKAPIAEGSYPAVIGSDLLGGIVSEKYVHEALARRADYAAAKQNIETNVILLGKAKNDMKPSLDLSITPGYGGLDESDNPSRYHQTFYNKVTGPKMFVSLNLELPMENNAARGELIRRKSLVREKELVMQELSNSIASQVMVSLKTVENTMNEYMRAKESREAYEKTVASETRKLKEGETSLTTLIDLEDRYYQSRISENSALNKYAVSLAKLRFVTGTILEKGYDTGKQVTFRLKNLMEIPFLEEP